MEINKLTAVGVANHKKKGRYADGNGLYLNIQADGNKNWLYRYQLRGKRHWMGLGGYDKKINSLATAREKALKAKALVGRGIDPISHREDEIRNNAEKVLISAQNKEMEDKLNSMTFKVCATDYINKMKGEWTNEKHTQQWINTLAKYAYPFIGEMPVKDIQIEDVKRCLDPIWSTKTETASRVRQRIGSILSFSIAHKYRQHSNPAIWKGLMDQFYPKPDKVKQKRRELEGTSEHHEALPYQNMPSFIVELRKLDGTAPIALYFTILTACRTSEVRFATWDEFDLAKKSGISPRRG